MTAVEYLFIELYQFINLKHYKEVNDIFDKAKEMEIMQLDNAYDKGFLDASQPNKELGSISIGKY